MPKPKPPAPWGRATLPTLREAAGLTRDRLALRASLAEKTLRDIEAGRAEPTPDQRARLTAVLELTKLCPAGALLIPFDDPKCREVLREALTDYAEKRRDPAAYVETLYGALKPQTKARHVDWAADEAATARALLAQLRAYS